MHLLVVLVFACVFGFAGESGQARSIVEAAAAQQRLNPPYLSEMPSAERVKQEIKGTDAMDTGARQAGVFWHLQQIIYTIALSQRRNRDNLTPDEKRLVDGYYADAYYALEPYEKELSKTPEGKQKFFVLLGYQRDPRVRDDALQRFFSPSTRALYASTDAIFEARHQAFLKAQAAEEKAAAQPTAGRGAAEEASARCIAAGRNPLDCAAEAFSQGFSDLVGIVNPSLVKTVPSGLRINGKYGGPGGFGLAFSRDAVTVWCSALVPAAHTYTVERKGAEIAVTVQNEPRPFTLKYRADGSMQGPGAVVVGGQIVTGTRQFNRHYADGRVEPMFETLTAPATRPCMVAGMAPAGVVTLPKGADLPVLGAASQQVSASKEFAGVAGLRMNGAYSERGGLAVEFNADESVVLRCRAALIAREYTVDWKGDRIAVTIQHGGQALVLSLAPDGSLAGSGNVSVTGRVVTGLANDSMQFAPKTDSCPLAVLNPATR
jgi:hypothetical protein